MKKLLLIFTALLLFFGMAGQTPVLAFTLPYSIDSEAVFNGGFEFENASSGSWREAGDWTPWVSYPATLDVPPPNDTETNVNVILNLYNKTTSVDYLTDSFDGGEGGTSGTIEWGAWMSYEYLSIKAGSVVDVFDIRGITDSNFVFAGLDGGALSHYTLWNGTNVPEPAGMFLLGTGLIGLAAMGRRRFRK